MHRRKLISEGFKGFGGLIRQAVQETKKARREEAKPVDGPADLFRPPGALPEHDFLNACTKCNDCMDACPHGIIYKHFDTYSNANLTPVISPSCMPCEMCEDTPCVTACDEGALVLAEGEKPKIGIARIYIDHCFTWTGEAECTACEELCPLPDKAIAADSQGRMRVKPALCDGCGHCVSHCPVGPDAIEVVALTNERTQPTD